MTAPGLPAASPQFRQQLAQAIAEARDPAAAADAGWDIVPEARVGAPVGRRRGRLVRRVLLALALLAGSAVHLADPSLLPRAWQAVDDATGPLIEQAWRQATSPTAARLAVEPAPAAAAAAAPPKAPAAPPPEAAPQVATAEQPTAAPPAASPPPAPAVDPIASPTATGGKEAAARPVVTGSLPPRAAPVAAPAPAPAVASVAPPPYAPPPPATDPLQKRAEAAGLHPGLSRTLLARLTDADYRNAAAAVGTALAETPDDRSHVRPRRQGAGVAQFRVHFVPGADTGCRRYVVTIAKDGWLTTALPMQRCGVRLRQAARR